MENKLSSLNAAANSGMNPALNGSSETELTHKQQREIRLVHRKYVEDAMGLSRSTLYRLMASNDFPAPVPLPGGGVRWVWSEVLDWAQQRIEARDAE